MEISTEELQALGARVVEFITRYLSSLDDQPILPKGLDLAGLRALIDEPLPRQPQGVEAALQDFETKIAAHSVRVGHPRFMGWIRTSPLAAAIYAEALAATLNQSVAVWEGAPAATEVELRVIEWIKEMCGYAPKAGGLLTSGGSMANFVCLLAARSALDPLARHNGLWNGPPMTVYVSTQTHYCIRKAAEMMGIGSRYVRVLPVDSALRMDPAALDTALLADRQAGLRPLAVAATMGTVNSGACDDLLAIGDVCRRHNVWLHVDGAYGGMAALVPEKRPLAAGLDQADSMVFDPHKGLYIPFEAGCALVREPAHLLAAFAAQADYLPNSSLDDRAEPFAAPNREEDFTPFHFRDYGPQLSRSFRALKIYLTLKTYGADAIAASLSRQYRLAALLAKRVQSDPDFELMAPAPLGIVAFRYCARPPAGVDDPAAWLDRLNARIVKAAQGGGNIFISGTCIADTYALRACFISYRTQESDLDIILDEIRTLGKTLC